MNYFLVLDSGPPVGVAIEAFRQLPSLAKATYHLTYLKVAFFCKSLSADTCTSFKLIPAIRWFHKIELTQQLL